jgi:glycosyltransferase involved in cell wall biosynthesis
MRILFWTEGFWPRIGGVETQGLLLMQGLQERGHQCTVIARRDCPEWKIEDEYQDIPIFRLDYNEFISTRNLRNLRLIEQKIEEFQPDIIHLNNCVDNSGYFFSFLRKNLIHTSIVLTLHILYVNIPHCLRMIKKVGHLVDRIACVSQSVMNDLQEHMPELEPKSRVIYNGIAMPEIFPQPLAFSPPVLLCLGRLSHEKGFDIALKAFSLLKKAGSNAELLIVGEGPYRTHLENQALELGLGNSVQFLGAVRHDQVSVYINRATIVLVPSFEESFGLTALEAQQMQRPVIASNVGGLKEIVRDKVTGLLVRPKDPEVLNQAIQTLLDDPDRAIQMGIEGQKMAATLFTSSENVQQYETLYRELRALQL